MTKAVACGDLMRFDLIDLQLFIAVADERSITRGALRAHLALASASAGSSAWNWHSAQRS